MIRAKSAGSAFIAPNVPRPCPGTSSVRRIVNARRGGGDMDKLLTTEEAAEILNIKRYTLICWRSKNTRVIGPAYIKVGRSVRYRVSDIEAWVETRKSKW